MKYAVAINEQGRYAPTQVGYFYFQPAENLHVWQGKFASSAKELAEQVNAASAWLLEQQNPFMTMRVVEIEPELEADSRVVSLLQANEELRHVIDRIEERRAA